MIELFELLITASAFSVLHAHRLYWVAMVRQNVGTTSGMKIYLNKTMATWCDTLDKEEIYNIYIK